MATASVKRRSKSLCPLSRISRTSAAASLGIEAAIFDGLKNQMAFAPPYVGRLPISHRSFLPKIGLTGCAHIVIGRRGFDVVCQFITRNTRQRLPSVRARARLPVLLDLLSKVNLSGAREAHALPIVLIYGHVFSCLPFLR